MSTPMEITLTADALLPVDWIEVTAAGGWIDFPTLLSPGCAPHAVMRRFDSWGCIAFKRGQQPLPGRVSVRVTGRWTTPPTMNLYPQAAPTVTGEDDPHSVGARYPFASYIEDCSMRWIHQHDPAMCRAAKFFRVFDIETSSHLMPRNRRADSADELDLRAGWVTALSWHLWQRMGERQGVAAVLPPPPLEHWAYLSALQLRLIEAEFGPVSEDAAIELIADCFGRFGSGEMLLRFKSPAEGVPYDFANGGPNGAYIFLFAECALRCIGLGLQAPQWRRLAPVFLTMQEVYLRAYGLYHEGLLVRRDAGAYGALPERALARAEVEQIMRDERRPCCDPEARMNAMVRRAFSSVAPPPVPTHTHTH